MQQAGLADILRVVLFLGILSVHHIVLLQLILDIFIDFSILVYIYSDGGLPSLLRIDTGRVLDDVARGVEGDRGAEESVFW